MSDVSAGCACCGDPRVGGDGLGPDAPAASPAQGRVALDAAASESKSELCFSWRSREPGWLGIVCLFTRCPYAGRPRVVVWWSECEDAEVAGTRLARRFP